MQDPSQGIQQELQPHVHLLSTYRFPQIPSLHPDKVAEWLLGAPKIARDQAPFYWTYLDRPVDGTILLVWQSLARGLEFPSDGYVWAPQETPFQIEVAGGYILEIYHQRVGYSPGESFATHSRRRFRLQRPRNPNHQGPMPDSQLWIVHYSQAEPNDRIPSNAIPIDGRIQQTMGVRQHLHAQGQIVQKDFMLNDRANWPSIAFPRARPQGQQPMYSGAVPPARIPQQMAYPPQQPQQGPPAKRPRTGANPSMPAASNAVAVLDVDDEEDTSRGDLFDHTTPREISMARYRQNHEWMEEILSSPYSISQIVPADLGLGVRGELGSLTEGIFDAPYDPDKDVERFSYVGRLDAGKAEEFRKRTMERIAKENREMEKMKAKHARRMAKFQKGAAIINAEKELRTAVNNPEDTGPEFWRLEGRIDDDSSDDGKTVTKTPAKVSDIVAQVEASVGRHALAVQELIRIQDGGFEEAIAIPSPPPALPSAQVTPPGSHNGSNNSGVMIEDADMDMNNSAAGLLDQFHTGFSANVTPGSTNFPTPQPHIHSAAATPDMHVPSPVAVSQPPQPHAGDNAAEHASAAGDVSKDPTAPGAEGEAAGGASDWVVVPEGGVSPPPHATSEQEPAATTNAPSTDSPAQAQTISTASASTPSASTTAPASASAPAAASSSTPTAAAVPGAAPTAAAEHSPAAAALSITAGTSTANTPGLPDFHTSPNDFADLGDLDSAGDALAGYGEEMEGGLGDGGLGDLGMDMDVDVDVGGMHHDDDDAMNLGDDIDLDVGDMEDSAFGDAFHGVGTPGVDTPGDGIGGVGTPGDGSLGGGL